MSNEEAAAAPVEEGHLVDLSVQKMLEMIENSPSTSETQKMIGSLRKRITTLENAATISSGSKGEYEPPLQAQA